MNFEVQAWSRVSALAKAIFFAYPRVNYGAEIISGLLWDEKFYSNLFLFGWILRTFTFGFLCGKKPQIGKPCAVFANCKQLNSKIFKWVLIEWFLEMRYLKFADRRLDIFIGFYRKRVRA